MEIEKIIPTIKWNIMSVIHGTPKSAKTGKFRFLKHFNEYLLNRKSEFISKWRHENKLPVQSAERIRFTCIFIAVLIF